MDFDAFKLKYQRAPVTELSHTVPSGPMVSVIVPTYQHGSFIAQALDGILAQKTDFPFEILLGEDGSSDGTRAICQQYARRHPDKIRLFQHDRRNVIGIGGNPTGRFNFSWLYYLARGRYAAICEGDDYWTDIGKLQRQVDFLEAHDDYALCFHNAAVLRVQAGEWKDSFTYDMFPWCGLDQSRAEYSVDDLIASPLCPTASVVFRLPSSRDLPDWFFHVPSGDIPLEVLLCRDRKIHFIAETWCAYRKHARGLTAHHKGDFIHQGRILTYIGLFLETGTSHLDSITRILLHHCRQMSRYAIPYDLKLWDALLVAAIRKCGQLPPTAQSRLMLALLYQLHEYGSFSSAAITRRIRLLPASDRFPCKPFFQGSKRILFVMHGPAQMNGPNVWLTRLLPGLRSKGFEPFVITFSTSDAPCPIVSELRRQDVRCYPALWEETEKAVARVLDWIRAVEPHVFVPNLNVPAYFASRWIKAAGVASVGMLHSDDRFYHDLIDEFVAGENEDYLDAIVAVSSTLEKRVREARPAGQLRIARLAYGAPVPSSTTRFGRPFRLVYAGRLTEPQKRIGETVRALQRATLEVPGVEAIIHGRGPAQKAVERILREEAPGHKVTFAGMVEANRLPEIYGKAHAFVLLSDYEGLSIALMEAMASGLVPVCTRVGSGHDELIRDGETGCFTPDRGDGFVKVVASLANDPEKWTKISESARNHIATGFSSDANIAEWVALLNAIAPGETEARKLPRLDPSKLNLPPVRRNPDGIAREDRRLSPQRTSSRPRDSDLPVCLVRSHGFNYSETFIEDHEAGLSRNLAVVHGFPLPVFDAEKRVVLPKESVAELAEASDDVARIDAYTRGFADYLKRSGARVVLAESGLMGVRVFRACRAAQVPLVVHFHGVDAYGKELLTALRPEFPELFKTAAAIVVVSEAMRRQLLSLGAPADKVLLSPYGVETAIGRQARPEEVAPRFLAVGRFVAKKAPDLTVRAFAEVFKVHPDARLVMVGDGPLHKKCVMLAARLGLASAVEFAGVRSREEVSRLMSESRCFVQHSVTAADGDSEGLPLAVLEAGAHGLPVVSTRHAGIPDAVREGVDGILVDERDVEGMVEAMKKIAADPGLAGKMGASYRDRVQASFNRKDSLARLRRILERAARGPDLPMPVDGTKAARALWRRGADSGLDPIEYCRRIIGLDRNFPPPYLELARTLIEKECFGEAYIALREASRTGVKLPDASRALLKTLRDRLPLNSTSLTEYEKRVGDQPVGLAETPLRILVVTNLFPPQEHGGYGRTMWEFCNGLRARGHTLRILTADCPELERPMDAGLESLEDLVERKLSLAGTWQGGVAVPETDPAKVSSVYRRNTSLVMREAVRFSPDVCLLGNIDFVGWQLCDALLVKEIPIIHRLGNELPGYPVGAMPTDPRFVMAGNTEWVNAGLRARGFACSRFEVVYPGSPLERYYRAFLPDRSSLRIAFAGIVTAYKGVHVLVDALCRLRAAGVAFLCEIAGDQVDLGLVGKLKEYLRAHHLEHAVSFIGYQNREGLAALYARSNVLVFPSVFEEPFGKTQIEAMAAGLLVISSGTGGTREIVHDGKNGIVFKTKDAADLAAKLGGLLADPDRWGRLAARGQADAFRFTTLNSVLKLERISQELVRRPAHC